jgi:hypothetical protein
LNRVEPGQHHALVIDTAWIDVIAVHLVDHPIHDLQLFQVPRGLISCRPGSGRGVDIDLQAVFDRPTKGDGERRKDDDQTK